VQGHALFTRQAGGDLPCPALDFTGGFNQFFGAAYNLTGKTIEQVYGAAFGERHTYHDDTFLSMRLVCPFKHIAQLTAGLVSLVWWCV